MMSNGKRPTFDAGARTAAPPHTTVGTVYLVGAGPGDPGLLTLRAVECLRQADLVLYDYLANPTLVEYAPATAELVRLGHHNGGPRLSPQEIIDTLVREALAGRTVVHLKGGDPSIFGRGGDEAAAFRAAGVPFEIVPGITSGLALAAYAEIPLTHHEDASAVALVTGHERDAKGRSHLDYAALARFPGTLVLYMGVTRAPEWSTALMEHGRAPETPVAIVRWCSRARQQTVRCTLGTVAEVVETGGLRPPALFVVGKVVNRTPRLSWFESRPLFGTAVLVAGSPRTAARLRERLAERGAEVITQPAIQVADPPDWGAVDAALQDLDQYDWLVFASPNGVDRLIHRLFDRGGDVRALAGVKLAALGAGTTNRLAQYHLRADIRPESFRPALLARHLVGGAAQPHILLAGAGRERPSLVGELEAAGARVDQLEVYSLVDVADPDPDVAQALADNEIQWIAVTSASTARSLVRLYGQALARARLASISPLTTAALQELGCAVGAQASPPTVAGLVDTITYQQQIGGDGVEDDPAAASALSASRGSP